ncbi:MAG: hypothetical protein ACRDY7_15805, partial [Acidimicrobiia bacterium]
VHHGRSRAFAPATPLEAVLAEAAAFATGDYASFLIRGAASPQRYGDGSRKPVSETSECTRTRRSGSRAPRYRSGVWAAMNG